MKIQLLVGAVVAAGLGYGGYAYLTRPLEVTPIESTTVATPEEVKGEYNYKLEPSKSSVEFSIHEVLRGKDFTAVGVSNSVTGALKFDGKDISSAMLADVKIDARTFKTDNKSRDGAIGRFVLKAEESGNETIVFHPTKIDGTLAKLSITGDLTISGKTKPVTFTGSAKVNDDESVSGEMSAKIKRSDFDLQIPDLSFLGGVDDEFTLTVKPVFVKVQ